MKANYKTRIRNAAKLLIRENRPAALLLSSSPGVIRSRDTHYPYRADSNLFYLTGIAEQGYALLLTSEDRVPTLFAPKSDPIRNLWEGTGANPRRYASAIGAELVVTEDIRKECSKKLGGFDTLFYQNTPQSAVGWQVARSLIEMPAHRRGKLPSRFIQADTLLGELRLYKDPSEIAAIKHSAKITSEALDQAALFIRPGVYERDIKAAIDYHFQACGAVPGFNTIVASGPNAAVLHYEGGGRKLKSGELLLIDCGAELNLYSADITRVFPASDDIDPIRQEIYEIVLSAQRAAIKAARPNVPYKNMYMAAARELTRGLVTLGVLKGKVSDLVAKRKFRPYFPHGIGHPLGLDVHDVGPFQGAESEQLLKPGMVLTVEPGLYFAKPHRKIPACGVRIEDDILITKNGNEVLTGADW